MRAYLRRMVSCPICNSDFTGLGWNLDFIRDEFKLNQGQVKKLTETLDAMTVKEVLALALALYPTKFVACPLAIVVVMENLVLVVASVFIPTFGPLGIWRSHETCISGGASSHCPYARIHKAFSQWITSLLSVTC